MFLSATKTGSFVDFTLRVSGITNPSNVTLKLATITGYSSENITVLSALNATNNSVVMAIMSGDGIYISSTITTSSIITVSGRYKI